MEAGQTGEHGDREVNDALQELLAAAGIEQPEQHFDYRGPIVVEHTTPEILQSALDIIDARRANGNSA